MDFDLHSSVSLRPRSFNALVASNEMFAKALNHNLNLQRFKVLYICSNSSSILTGWTASSRTWRSAEPSQYSSS